MYRDDDTQRYRLLCKIDRESHSFGGGKRDSGWNTSNERSSTRPSSSKFSSRNERNGNTKDRYLRVSEVTAGRIHTLTSSNRRRRGRLECTASYTKKITNTSYIVQCTYPSFPFETRVSNFVSKILPLDSGDLVDILIFVNEIFLPRK